MVENRPGAGGLLGIEAGVRADPDFFLSSTSTASRKRSRSGAK